jgi:hypothetical protein
LADVDGEAFSYTGQCIIVLWGLAYIAAGYDRDASTGRSIDLLFALEKAFFVWHFFVWSATHDASKIVSAEMAAGKTLPMVGLFFTLYGYADAGCGALFLFSWLQSSSPVGATGTRKASSRRKDQ